MNLKLKFKGENREEPLKSPRRMTPQPKPHHTVSKSNEIPKLTNYLKTFRKQIEIPINYQTSIFLSRTPQRCISHNNVVTLFCINDKKPLCVNCIYQNSPHKKHQVIPISKAAAPLKEQVANNIQKINNLLMPNLSELIKKSQANLQQVQSQMKQIINQVTKYYRNLSSFILTKKNEHVHYYQLLWSRFRYQYSSFTTELTKTNQFVIEKMKEISERVSQQHLLFNLNIVSNIAKIEGLLTPSLTEYQVLEIKNIQGKMVQTTKMVQQLLNFDYRITPDTSFVQREQSRRRSNDKIPLWKTKKENLNKQTSQKTISPINLHSPRISHKQILKLQYTPREWIKNTNFPKFGPHHHYQLSTHTPKKFSIERNAGNERTIRNESWIHEKTLKDRNQEKVIVTQKISPR